LGLRFGWSKDNTKAILATKGVTNPSVKQMKEALDQVEEEHHAIVFLYKVDEQKYRKLIEEKGHDVLQNKDTLLAGWKNRYISIYNRFSDENYGIAFTITAGSSSK